MNISKMNKRSLPTNLEKLTLYLIEKSIQLHNKTIESSVDRSVDVEESLKDIATTVKNIADQYISELDSLREKKDFVKFIKNDEK